MLDFSWSHILIVLIVALVVVGPKDLPRLMHMLGRWMGKARSMADQLRSSFDDMARQGELEELRKEINALREARIADNTILAPHVEEPVAHENEKPVEPIAPGAEPPPP